MCCYMGYVLNDEEDGDDESRMIKYLSFQSTETVDVIKLSFIVGLCGIIQATEGVEASL